jgi:elongation factor Tu
MSHHKRSPDARVTFELTAFSEGGGTRQVLSGYRPAYDVRADYWTSVSHEFANAEGARTGERVAADVWFITPEVYPGTLWPGRVIRVAEGSRVVGIATVEQVLNPVLGRLD